MITEYLGFFAQNKCASEKRLPKEMAKNKSHAKLKMNS